MQDTRQDFYHESDEEFRQTLRHQVRTSSEVNYVTGEKVYKRRTDDYWKGPATIIGQENEQVLIKDGSTYQRMHPCRSRLIDSLFLSKMEQNPENTEEVNSYDSKEIRVSGNNEQYVSAEMDTDEFDEASLQIEPDNSNAEQPDDTYDESLLDSTILPKVKDRVVFIKEARNEWERKIIHSRGGKQTGKYKDWVNIIDEEGNIENIDWKSIK